MSISRWLRILAVCKLYVVCCYWKSLDISTSNVSSRDSICFCWTTSEVATLTGHMHGMYCTCGFWYAGMYGRVLGSGNGCEYCGNVMCTGDGATEFAKVSRAEYAAGCGGASPMSLREIGTSLFVDVLSIGAIDDETGATVVVVTTVVVVGTIFVTAGSSTDASCDAMAGGGLCAGGGAIAG